MTKAELIFNISQRAGIPETEAQVFFESFLKKVAANINAGGAVRVDNLGMFIIKEGVSESIKARRKESKIEHEISELVIFEPEKPDDGDSSDMTKENDSLVFNLPNLKGEPKSNIDSYFSISFDKPVVNRSTAADIEGYYPMSRNEQKRILESKAEKLFSEVKIFDRFGEESEKYLFIGKQRPDSADLKATIESQVEILNDTLNASAGSEKEITKETTEVPIQEAGLEEEDIDLSKIVKENLAWDFGVETLDNSEVKISPPGLADKVEINTPTVDMHLTPGEYASENDFESDEEVNWDFGNEPEEFEKELNKIESESQQSRELQDLASGKFRKTGDDFVSETLKEVIKESETIPVSDNYFEPEFESVNSMTSELQKDKTVEDQMNWDFGRSDSTETIPGNVLEEIQHEDGFVQISGKSSQRNNIYNQGEGGYKPTVDFENQPSVFQKILKFALFGLVGVLAALVCVYAYFKFVKHQDLLNQPKIEAVLGTGQKSKPELIDRSYDVPVTYPYEKKAMEQTESTVANVKLTDAETAKQAPAAQVQNEAAKTVENQINKKDVKQADKKAELKKEPEQKPKQEKPADKNATAMPKAGEHSFYDGSQYVIQLSSWPSKEKADAEAAKLKKQGYASFVSSAYLEAKKATWYRVRVGGFGSKEAAEKAYSKLFR